MHTYIIGTNKLDKITKQSIKEHKTKLVLKNKTWIYNPHANSVITTITLNEYEDVSKLIDVEDRNLELKYNTEYQTYIFPICDIYGILNDTISPKDIYVKLQTRDDMYADCSNSWRIATDCLHIDEKSYVTEEDIEKLKHNIKYVPHVQNYYNNTHGAYLPLNTNHDLFKQLWCNDYVYFRFDQHDDFMLPDETPANYRVSTDMFDLSITINKLTYKLINIADPTNRLKLYRFETEINKVEYDNIMFIYEQIKNRHDKIKSISQTHLKRQNCDIVNTNSCYEKDGKFYIQFTKAIATNRYMDTRYTDTCELLQEIHLRFTNYANKFSISTTNSCQTGEPIKDSPPAEIIICLPNE